MIWAIVSSRSCFCWLYRASPSLAAKNIINLISVSTIWRCPCIESSFVLLEKGICYDLCILSAKLSLCPASFCTPRPNLPVTPGIFWLPTFTFQSPMMKRTSFLGVSSRRFCGSSSVQFSSVTQSCLTLCDPMDCSTPGLSVHRQLPEFTQTHVHRVGDAIQPSHPLLSPSPPAFNLSQHQSLSKWVSSLHQVTKVLDFQLQHQSFQWIFRTDFL